MDFKQISTRAKDLVEKRGGSESLKRDAEELRGIAKGPGSLKDKAKAAVSAIKEPGATGARETEGAQPSPAAAATGTERDRAEEKVKGERRGKHANGGAGETPGAGAGAQGRAGEKRGAGEGGPAV